MLLENCKTNTESQTRSLILRALPNTLKEIPSSPISSLAMKKEENNQVKAAELLGLKRGTLQYKLKKIEENS